jgi:hypothetical protein
MLQQEALHNVHHRTNPDDESSYIKHADTPARSGRAPAAARRDVRTYSIWPYALERVRGVALRYLFLYHSYRL